MELQGNIYHSCFSEDEAIVNTISWFPNHSPIYIYDKDEQCIQLILKHSIHTLTMPPYNISIIGMKVLLYTTCPSNNSFETVLFNWCTTRLLCNTNTKIYSIHSTTLAIPLLFHCSRGSSNQHVQLLSHHCQIFILFMPGRFQEKERASIFFMSL